jgi:type IV secretory pathway VirB10-like protein
MRRGVFLVPLVVILLLLGGVAWWFWQRPPRPASPQQTDMGSWPSWMAKREVYKAPEPPLVAPTTPAPEARLAGELANLRQFMLGMQQDMDGFRKDIEDLKQRPATAPAATAPTPAGPPVKRKAQSMLFVAKEATGTQDATASGPSAPGTYTLMPGTFIPCSLMTALNSDVGDAVLVATTTTTVYDTATGQFPLILPHSTIVGSAQGSQLVYGNERIRTVSLSLSRRQDTTPIDLGNAPLTDQAGIEGLTGRVDQHYLRLFGAVFIGGALKGGTQAMTTALTGAGPVGQVGGGIAQSGQHVVQQQSGPALSTRPTIEVDGGQSCQIVLIKPLHLTVAR